MTPSEKFVSELCNTSFLPFWSFTNPRGKNLEKELCDILVVCDPDIIIISVKDIAVKETQDYNVDVERWTRNAIDESVKQIYGAERILGLKEEVYLSDKKTKVALPKNGVRNIYRIALAFGSKEKYPISFGDFGKGFVHVFDETAIHIILNELDTITDFVSFLNAFELFCSKNILHLSSSGENYLGLYLNHGFDFPEPPDTIFIDDEYWNDYSNTTDYLEYKAANKISYFWDSIIQEYHTHFEKNNLLPQLERNDIELSLRNMNKESRISRRELSHLFLEVLNEKSDNKNIRARLAKADKVGSIVYVLMRRNTETRNEDIKELRLRCIAARLKFKDSQTIIGIARDPVKRGGYSNDLCYLYLPVIEQDLEKEANNMIGELGYFNSAFRKQKPTY